MRRIKSIEVENFKSLVDFWMDLSKFNCLIGMNGSGKSTVLQFIDFLSQQVRGELKQWFEDRKWKPADVRSKLTKKRNVEWRVEFAFADGQSAGVWQASYNPSDSRCTKERIDLPDAILEVTKDSVEIHYPGSDKAPQQTEITFSYEGSILSQLKEDWLPDSILECKKLFANIKSLELLAPEYLRQRTRDSAGTLGLGGQNLSAFLHEMGDRKRLELVQQLRQAYPFLQGLHARPLRSGWKQLEINEAYEGNGGGLLPEMTTEARHVNDGMLRLIAILAELQSDHQFLLFDEIENGINPELVEFVTRVLTETPKQIVVTTHSPMILNYLDDETARDGVTYLYKTRSGHTQAIPFFSIPSLAEKLKVMGPGEAFVDTNLTELRTEITTLVEGA